MKKQQQRKKQKRKKNNLLPVIAAQIFGSSIVFGFQLLAAYERSKKTPEPEVPEVEDLVAVKEGDTIVYTAKKG